MQFAKRAKEQGRQNPGNKNPFNKFNKAGKPPWAGKGPKVRFLGPCYISGFCVHTRPRYFLAK